MEQNSLLAAGTVANSRIRELANQNPTIKGLGTTLVGVIIEGDHLALVNRGDSRLYRIRDQQIEQITQDHTVVEEQERMGPLSKEEVSRHSLRHILTGALGMAIDNIEIDASLIEILEKDLYLICSHGLNDMIGDKEILKTVNLFEGKSLGKIGLSLIQQAKLASGRDNTTVVLLPFY